MKKKDFYDYMKIREQKHLEEIIELKDRIEVLETVIKYECKESL